MRLGRRCWLVTIALATTLSLSLFGQTASAQSASALDDALAPDVATPYWYSSFFGGLMVPIAAMENTHEQGLVAIARFGWMTRDTFGFGVTGSYSPLPRRLAQGADPGTVIDTHFAVASAAPRLMLGRKTVRFWLSAGGGVVMERTAESLRGMRQSTDYEFEPAAVGETGLELHLFSNGGFSLSGSYTHSFGEIDSRAYSALAGLVFTFE
jgi:hypothetical protein